MREERRRLIIFERGAIGGSFIGSIVGSHRGLLRFTIILELGECSMYLLSQVFFAALEGLGIAAGVFYGSVVLAALLMLLGLGWVVGTAVGKGQTKDYGKDNSVRQQSSTCEEAKASLAALQKNKSDLEKAEKELQEKAKGAIAAFGILATAAAASLVAAIAFAWMPGLNVALAAAAAVASAAATAAWAVVKEIETALQKVQMLLSLKEKEIAEAKKAVEKLCGP